MKILLVSRQCPSYEADNRHCELIKGLVETTYFKNNGDKLASIFPSESSEISIKDDGLINFGIESVGDKSIQIPDLNPMAINDIFNFFNEFNADIVNSFDDGYLGLLAQVWAIQKRVPFVYTNTNNKNEFKTRTSKVLNKIFKITGLSGEFYNNFYHNATAIFIFNKANLNILEEIEYKGTIINFDENISDSDYLLKIYNNFKSLIKAQPKYIKSSIFRKITNRFSFDRLLNGKKNKKKEQKKMNIDTLVFTGGAVLTSIIAFTAWKNLKKIKNKISKEDTN